ncbi:MAG TPA: hypothetical protein VMJ65_01160 [Solirubrobacteraceae bacterium]|nr:hypothetical protein [Solirubrobacteraceae bacterium]
MIGRRTFVALATVALVGALALTPATSGAQTTTQQHDTYTGTTSDGSGWIADVPSRWNGTLLLYSHGYGTLAPADSPDPTTQEALLSMGYALAGSGYDPKGSLWALNTAVGDQFAALAAVEKTVLPHRPSQVVAFGTSMGGLISALEDQSSDRRLDGALTTCGIVAGGLNLNNYQLDGEYAMTQLLGSLVPGGQSIQLVNFPTADASAVSAGELQNLGEVAQGTSPQTQARLALAMAFLNTTTWSPIASAPAAANDYAGQEAAQYETDFGFAGFPIIPFIVTGRYAIEQAVGGNAGWTLGVNFARELATSPFRTEVEALYRQAGLNLRADLNELTRNANITASPSAVRNMIRTSVPTGRLQVPELDLHTIGDNLVPVTMENWYRGLVDRSGSGALLQQAYVARPIHCYFTPSELIAGVQAVQHRIETRHWGSSATPQALEASATNLAHENSMLGTPAFVPYEPAPLLGDNGPFDPFTGGSFPFPPRRW